MTAGPRAPARTRGPGWGRLALRGATMRCPACGTRHLFTRWLRMAEHCPGCGMRFEREEGFFLGVYFMNITLTQVVLMAYIAAAFGLSIPDPPLLAILGGAGALAVIVPFLCYPMSRTLWAAVHFGMQPLEPHEEADAAAFRFERGDAVVGE
ncbi:MAG: DUF983 domain-containing protein [Actinomycetota bacterium]|nr:DUF983 domain-containing protein [Actinomycetota bacterium]